MPRKPRIEYEGAAYHVMCRGDRKEAIFWDDEDRDRFLQTLWECCDRTGWRVHAYVLMGNHYHLLMETPEPNLVDGMRWFQGTYTARFNARHRVHGHLFQGRYKALPIEPGESGYFLQASSYIHLNPVRARLLQPADAPLELYPWSSYPDYLCSARMRRRPIVVGRVLGELALADDRAGRRGYGEHLERLRAEAEGVSGDRRVLEEEWNLFRRGWYLGSEIFRDRLLERVDDVMASSRRKSFSGEEAKAHDAISAERLVACGLQALGLTGQNLHALKKLDVRKQVVAWWVRKQTMVSNHWLSERLGMGDEGNISKVIKAVDQSKNSVVRGLKNRMASAAPIPKSGD